MINPTPLYLIMRKSLIILLLTFLITGCDEKQYSTSISGRVLEEGSLEPILNDSLYIEIIEGVPCGVPCIGGKNTSNIATVPVINGKYEYHFMANDRYHWMLIRDAGTNYAADIPFFEIYPGENQVRDFIVPKQSEIKFVFSDKGRFPNKKGIHINSSESSGPRWWITLDSTSISPYEAFLKVVAGRTYSFEVGVTYENTGFTETYYYEIPYNDTLEINIDI